MTLEEITKAILKFRDARNWKQFHTPKDIALSLLIEASEYAELLQFKSETQLADLDRTEVARELADVLYWVVLAAHEQGIDLSAAFKRKMRENNKKYPVEKFKNSNKKYR